MNEFSHAMLREIFEQPAAIQRTLDLYLNGDGLSKEAFAPIQNWLNSRGEVLIAASGSSRHAGLAAEIIFEDLCGLAVDVEYSSEYSCRPAVNPRQPSVLVISQSGETSDTLAALRFAKDGGQQTLAIANVAGSTMLREADAAMPLAAGPELAIPATKSFTGQLTALYLLSLFEGSRLGTFETAQLKHRMAELRALPALIERQLDAWRTSITALAARYSDAASFLYLGRGVHYAIAREGALKMKESSYVQAEGYPTGELKHGPNALVSKETPLVMLATVDRSDAESVERYSKVVQLMEDMRKQGATIVAIANSDDETVAALADYTLTVDEASEGLLAICEVIPLQIFSYCMAIQNGIDVDHPRNLNKAVLAE